MSVCLSVVNRIKRTPVLYENRQTNQSENLEYCWVHERRLLDTVERSAAAALTVYEVTVSLSLGLRPV